MRRLTTILIALLMCWPLVAPAITMASPALEAHACCHRGHAHPSPAPFQIGSYGDGSCCRVPCMSDAQPATPTETSTVVVVLALTGSPETSSSQPLCQSDVGIQPVRGPPASANS